MVEMWVFHAMIILQQYKQGQLQEEFMQLLKQNTLPVDFGVSTLFGYLMFDECIFFLLSK